MAIHLPCGFVRSDSAAHYVPQSWLCLLHILLFYFLLLIDAATAANMNARGQLIKPPSQRQCCICNAVILMEVLSVIRAIDCRSPITVRIWCNCLYGDVQPQLLTFGKEITFVTTLDLICCAP